MADKSKIEWTNATWNPVRGCAKVSEGCRNCYAMRQAHRTNFLGGAYEGLTEIINGRPQWNGNISMVPKLLDWPLRKRKPLKIFVNSMSDLFHDDVPESFIRSVFVTMAAARHHIFQVLTKRAVRMQEILAQWSKDGLTLREGYGTALPNVWLGISAEDQATADERIPLLLQTPAVVRFISYEPALGPLYLDQWLWSHTKDDEGVKDSQPSGMIGWVIAGGESGPGARPSHPDWFRSLRDQCQAAGVPYFFKQWVEWEIASAKNGHHGSVMPETGEKYTWIGKNGKTFNPSAPDGQDCYSMAKVGKKKAGRLLDGRTWDEYPESPN